MNLTTEHRERIAAMLTRWTSLDVRAGALKESIGMELDDSAMCVSIGNVRALQIEQIVASDPNECGKFIDLMAESLGIPNAHHSVTHLFCILDALKEIIEQRTNYALVALAKSPLD